MTRGKGVIAFYALVVVAVAGLWAVDGVHKWRASQTRAPASSAPPARDLNQLKDAGRDDP